MTTFWSAIINSTILTALLTPQKVRLARTANHPAPRAQRRHALRNLVDRPRRNTRAPSGIRETHPGATSRTLQSHTRNPPQIPNQRTHLRQPPAARTSTPARNPSQQMAPAAPAHLDRHQRCSSYSASP